MLKKDEILARTDNGLNVFRYYITGNWRVGRNFLNPLYEDKKASCNIFFDRHNGVYKMKDFGNDGCCYDCFSLVGNMNGLNCANTNDFVEIMRIIDKDLTLGLSDEIIIMNNQKVETVPSAPNQTAEPLIERKAKPYKFREQPFSNAEMDFWSAYGISKAILSTYNVTSLSSYESVRADGKPFTLIANKQEPMFGYKSKRFIKLYRPYSSMRFLYGGTLGDNYCFGLEQLPAKGDTIFITGGEKDVMTLASKGFYAICFNSETVSVPINIIHKLSFRFKHIILLYDMDKTGIESSKKHEKILSEYGVKRLALPLSGLKEEKDISDYFRKGYTKKDFIKLFIELLDTLYSDTMAILKSCEIDYKNPPAKALEIISAGEVPLGTQGNLLCITGGEGTGKSNYIAALIAGSIREQEETIDTLGIEVIPNINHKAVLLYDTEQSEVQLHKNISNLLRRAKSDDMPTSFKAFCLTSMSRKERLQAIIQSMDKFHYEYGGIQLVVIDGIADLVRCANDEVESIAIIDELYRLAGIYQTCIVTVLHFIPNGLKLRGHLGSELQRKAAAILSIEKDDNPAISVVKAIKVRDGSPLDVPLMQFSWNKGLGMHTYIGEKSREVKEQRKQKELEKLAKEVFEKQNFITYIDLCEQIQQIMDVSERTAKSYIKFMRNNEIVIKDPSNQSYFIRGMIKQ